jgi:hypothetical protein
MSLPKEITMTRDGGFYWRAQMFRYAFTYAIIIPVLIAVILAVINPFWFRDSFFRFMENRVNRIAQWRNYRMYALYLGCDPKMWHTLKDAN